MSDVSICHYRLSRVEYDRAVEAGVVEANAKLELIDGQLQAKPPKGSRHATGVEPGRPSQGPPETGTITDDDGGGGTTRRLSTVTVRLLVLLRVTVN